MSKWSLALAPVVVLLARDASALPAPFSQTELDEQSAYIVDVTVTDAKCDAVVDAADKKTTTVVSTLKVDKADKGKPGETLSFTGFDIDWKGAQPSCSAITSPLPKGWKGKLYLTDKSELVAWNGVKEDTATSKPAGYTPCGTATGGTGGGGGTGGASGTGGTTAAGGASGAAGTGSAAPAEADEGGCAVSPGRLSGSQAPNFALTFVVAGAAVAMIRHKRR